MARRLTFLVWLHLAFFWIIAGATEDSVQNGIVLTEAKVTLHRGTEGVLPCTVPRRPFAVYWKRGPTYDEATQLVYMDMYYRRGEKGGPGYELGLFDIAKNFSLIIKNVKIEDQEQYFCEVSDFELGELFHNHTDVTVVEKHNVEISTFPQTQHDLFTVTPSNSTTMQGSVNWIVIVLPLATVVILIPIVGWMVKIGRNRRGREKTDEDIELLMRNNSRAPISYAELWDFVELTKVVEDINVAEKLLTHLNERTTSRRVTRGRTNEEYYQALCSWKGGTKRSRQRAKFSKACQDVGVRDTVTAEEGVPRSASDDDLLHVLWKLGNLKKIKGLLKMLGLNHADIQETSNPEIKRTIGNAMEEMKKWRDQTTETNPRAILSLAMERLKCHPTESDFFRLSLSQKESMPEDYLRKIIRDLAGRHYKKLTYLAGPKVILDTIDNGIKEDNDCLFNTEKMVLDWVNDQNCSHYNKRCNLERACKAYQERETSSEAPIWPRDSDLKELSPYLTEPICQKLGIQYTSEESGRFEALCEWRNNMTGNTVEKMHNELLVAFEDHGLGGHLYWYGAMNPATLSATTYWCRHTQEFTHYN